MSEGNRYETQQDDALGESEEPIPEESQASDGIERARLHKPFRTIDEQIKILNERGLRTDESTRFILEREGYYPVINGYKDLFLDHAAGKRDSDDVFFEGTQFNDIYRLFVFDRDLRTTFMRYFAMAEAALKTICSYVFTEAHAYEKNPYMNVANYCARHQKKGRAPDLIEEFGKAIGQEEGNGQWRKKTYLRHYIEDHDGEVPLWVLMNYATLGQAFRFFCFMEEGMRNDIAKVFSGLYCNSYGVEKRVHPRMLRIAFDHVKDFRNICAHDERLYCARVSPSSDTPVAKVIDDLELLIPKETHERLRNEVTVLVRSLVADVPRVEKGIVDAMGIDSEGLV